MRSTMKLIVLLLLFTNNASHAQQVLGDNLGNHSATGTLVMNNHSITKARNIYSQGVLIGTLSFTNNNVILEVKDTQSAIVLPSVENIFDPISPSIVATNAINGMMAYDIASKSICVYQDSRWISFASENLPEGQVYIGSANNKATPKQITGDITLASSGVATIANDAVKQNTFADKSITTTKLSDLSISGDMLKNNILTREKIAGLSVDVSKIVPGFANQILTARSTGQANWSYLPQSFTVGDIKPIITGFGTVPTGWVYCNGQVLNDAASILNGKTIPNLNASNYLIGGDLTLNGSTAGAVNTTLAKANLPAVILNGTLLSRSAGTPVGSISVGYGTLPAHTHQYTDSYFTSYSNSWKNGGASNDHHGLPNRVDRTSASNGTHAHTASFLGNVLPEHTHDASAVVNSAQSVFNLQPKSYVFTYIMKVK